MRIRDAIVRRRVVATVGALTGSAAVHTALVPSVGAAVGATCVVLVLFRLFGKEACHFQSGVGR